MHWKQQRGKFMIKVYGVFHHLISISCNQLGIVMRSKATFHHVEIQKVLVDRVQRFKQSYLYQAKHVIKYSTVYIQGALL